jgi:hypothetical protein
MTDALTSLDMSTGLRKVAERGSSRQGCHPAGASPVAPVARLGCVVMPLPGVGNQPGVAWCKRPGCSGGVEPSAVGATGRSNNRECLNISEYLQPRNATPP